MFDVGFSELIVIAVVALVVIGPERLPSVARTVGAMLGRAQRYFNSVKAEVNRELQLDELKRIQQETYDRVMAMEAEVHNGLAQIENTVHETAATVTEPVAEIGKHVDETVSTALSAPVDVAEASVPVLAVPAIETAETPAPVAEVSQTDLFASPSENLSRLTPHQGSTS